MTNHAPGGGMICGWCKKPGHDELDCPTADAETVARLRERAEVMLVSDKHLLEGAAAAIEQLRSQLSAALQRAEAAEAIVAKLPKTADGVPVVPGMHLFTIDPAGHVSRFSHRCDTASSSVSSRPLPSYAWERDCYSTEAALAAAGEGGGTK
jgi:hypothetical protein